MEEILNNLWGFITMIVAFSGFLYILFINREQNLLTRSISGLFLVTGLFGLATYLKTDLDYVLYPMRIVILVFIVYIIYRHNY
jgi:hypothetical protein